MAGGSMLKLATGEYFTKDCYRRSPRGYLLCGRAGFAIVILDDLLCGSCGYVTAD